MLSEFTHTTPAGTEIRIRKAEISDLDAINDIYNYYVLNSTCTYQITPETIQGRTAWFNEHDSSHPVIVAMAGKDIAGWASLSRFNKREAYSRTAEDSVYVRHDMLLAGIGTALLGEIIAVARRLDYHTIIAGISADQAGSIRLHEKSGFDQAGRMKETGFKFGRWLDTAYYQLML